MKTKLTFTKNEWDNYLKKKIVPIIDEAYNQGVADTKKVWGWKIEKRQYQLKWYQFWRVLNF